MFIRNRSKFLALGIMGILAIAAVACGSDTPAVQPTSTSVPQATATPVVMSTEEPHDHASHEHGPVDSAGMSVDTNVAADAISGVNIEIIPTGFSFTPENVNLDHVDGEGHAHVFIDGVKYGRVYTPWVHVPGLEPGDHNIAVTLNANTHAEYTSNGLPVIVNKVVTVPEPGDGHAMHHDSIEAGSPMSVQVVAEPDAAAGANISITVDGFVFTPENVNQEHVDGEGHAHVYVDGKKIGRVYGPNVHLGDLTEGEHEIRVTLNANTHADYLLNGEIVEAVTTVNVTTGVEAMDDGHLDYGHMDDHHDDRMTDSHDDAVMDAEAGAHEDHAEPVKQ